MGAVGGFLRAVGFFFEGSVVAVLVIAGGLVSTGVM